MQFQREIEPRIRAAAAQFPVVITALDAELRTSRLRVLPGKHAILCLTPNPYPIDERTIALPHTHLHELLAPPSA